MAGVTIRVYLLDDHEIVRRGLRELLESAGDMVVVGESGLAITAVRQILALRPDVAIFDARLPDGSGIDACREARSADPTIKALVLTSFDDEQALATAILAGASGFLLKDIKGNGLIEAIRRVAAGENLLDPASSGRLLQRWQVGEATERADHRLRLLTPQERRVLDLIAAGRTNRQIGAALALAEKTVKNYVTSVLGKLGMTSRTQAAVYAATRSGHDGPG
ncbi:MAG: response regulator transcription factor [Micrococcales bacterium]|nr:response regulator transcription factor [Micrococcales bacterium]